MKAFILFLIVNIVGCGQECDYKLMDVCIFNSAKEMTPPSKRELELAFRYWNNIYSIHWMKNGHKAFKQNVKRLVWIEGPPEGYEKEDSNPDVIVCGKAELWNGTIYIRLDKWDESISCGWWVVFHEMAHNMLYYNELNTDSPDTDIRVYEYILNHGRTFNNMLNDFKGKTLARK